MVGINKKDVMKAASVSTPRVRLGLVGMTAVVGTIVCVCLFDGKQVRLTRSFV
jgi:hypothetical protein